jgi:DNA-binding GntR family transcriptional regulator
VHKREYVFSTTWLARTRLLLEARRRICATAETPVPDESTLMQRYGVARETARKAVRVLVAEGLVYVVQDRGAYVAER